MKTFNPYRIKWAVLTPEKGAALKYDNTLINKVSLSWGRKQEEILIHAPSQTLLNKKIESIRGKLRKTYSVLFITNKQFELKEENQSFLDIATKRQVLDQFIIC